MNKKISSLRYKSDGYVYGDPACPGGVPHLCEQIDEKGNGKEVIFILLTRGQKNA